MRSSLELISTFSIKLTTTFRSITLKDEVNFIEIFSIIINKDNNTCGNKV
jgi:hypothetical protein